MVLFFLCIIYALQEIFCKKIKQFEQDTVVQCNLYLSKQNKRRSTKYINVDYVLLQL